jgi:hypothetical protein
MKLWTRYDAVDQHDARTAVNLGSLPRANQKNEVMTA